MNDRPKYPTHLAISLGNNDTEVERRKKALDELADVYRVNRSKLLQMIADGQLDVVPARREQAV